MRDRREFLQWAGLGLGSLALKGCAFPRPSGKGETGGSKKRPNVVIIYADDLGYGDVSFLNPASKIRTPNIDRLARSGIWFTDAHSPDAICSPSRYGLLTGRYSWRTSLKKGNPPPGSQPWIGKGRLTLAWMMKGLGYDTAAVGKWGLGADWASAAKPGRKGLDISPGAIDYSKPIPSGRPAGFDYDYLHLWFGYKSFRKVYPGDPTPGRMDGGRWYFENGMAEGGRPDFPAFDMCRAQVRQVERVTEYIDAKGGRLDHPPFHQRKGAPFFLYYAPHIPHTPLVPDKRFRGKSGAGVYGDYVLELDWAVGEIMAALERNGFLENTIVIFTSDNGPERFCYERIRKYRHFSMDGLRGVKRDVWEGGHRVPFIFSWPAGVRKKGRRDRLVSQLDIFATLADVLGFPLPEDAAEDSFSFADEIDPRFRPSTPARTALVHHSADDKYALRSGKWLFVEGRTGDNGRQEPEWFRKMRGVVPHREARELFDLEADLPERVNLYGRKKNRARRLQEMLDRIRKAGRSRPRGGRRPFFPAGRGLFPSR